MKRIDNSNIKGEAYDCPKCHMEVYLSTLLALGAERDAAHQGGNCPYCKTYCCFTCGHIYDDEGDED